jgi:hypothetical protein
VFHRGSGVVFSGRSRVVVLDRGHGSRGGVGVVDDASSVA